MSRCTDKSDDATLSSSNNTATVDDTSKGINKVTLEDVNNAPPYDIISGEEEEEMDNSKKCTSREQNLEHTKTDEISHNSASGDADTTNSVSGDVDSGAEVYLCANCGKEGATNTCNKCNMTKYCNAACKKKHRSKHKKDCEEHVRHAAKEREEEIKRALELRDKELFNSLL